MRVLVAGGSGVIGARIVPLLVAAGHEVTATTRTPEKKPSLEAMGARGVVCDALDAEGLRAAMAAARPECVVHQMTRIPRAIDPRRYESQFAANDRLRREGTASLVAAARAAGARRIVAQSIAFAYVPRGPAIMTESEPLFLRAPLPWRRSIAAIDALERAVREADGLEGTVLRYGHFYGPGTAYAPDGHTAALVRKRRFPVVGEGRGIFSFIHVHDAAAATIAAVEGSTTGTFNIVDDDPAMVREWLPLFARAIGAPRPWRVPHLLARMMAGPHAVFFMTRMRGASNAKARTHLGWAPRIATWRRGFFENLT